MRRSSTKKWIAVAAAVSCFMGTGAAVSASEAGETAKQTEAAASETEAQIQTQTISWWICSTGEYADESRVQKLVDLYEAANPQADVEVRILDQETGAEEIDEALGSEDGPDVVLAAPEDIVTRWGNDGLMEDLSALWDDEIQREYRSEMRDTAKNREDVWYAVPLFRDVFSMAINYDAFREAGALQYLNEEVHSWKDSGFIDAVLRVHDVLVEKSEQESSGSEASGKGDAADNDAEASADTGIVGKVYCKDETGQRAFMCFVSNFFNTGLVDEYRSSYQLGKGKIRDVFSTLRKLEGKGIAYDPEMDGDDENEAFLNGEVFLTFNWSASKQRTVVRKDGEAPVHIFPMMFPNSKNTPFLTGTVGALGVPAAKNEQQKEAAISFVRYLMTDEEAYTQAVLLSGCFAARRRIAGKELTGLYGDDQAMKLYETLNEYYGTYEPTMELYPDLEQAWPQMLRELADGARIKKVMKRLGNELNERLEEEYGIRLIEVDEEEEVQE